jgi:hypothetical protein
MVLHKSAKQQNTAKCATLSAPGIQLPFREFVGAGNARRDVVNIAIFGTHKFPLCSVAFSPWQKTT